MRYTTFALLLLLPLLGAADVYKYTDGTGQVYFTDTPLEGKNYRLNWRREAQKYVLENDKKLIAIGRSDPPSRGAKRVAVSKSLAKRRSRFAGLIDSAAVRFNLPSELLHAVIRAESSYNPSAVSPAGAVGLMQLMPATAKRYGVNDIWDPAENIQGGAKYLRYLLDLFEQDVRLALAGYNAGENAVIKYGKRIPPYRETQQYVRKVLQFLWAERAG